MASSSTFLPVLFPKWSSNCAFLPLCSSTTVVQDFKSIPWLEMASQLVSLPSACIPQLHLQLCSQNHTTGAHHRPTEKPSMVRPQPGEWSLPGLPPPLPLSDLVPSSSAWSSPIASRLTLSLHGVHGFFQTPCCLPSISFPLLGCSPHLVQVRASALPVLLAPLHLVPSLAFYLSRVSSPKAGPGLYTPSASSTQHSAWVTQYTSIG